mgnify:CR=1 FL=1
MHGVRTPEGRHRQEGASDPEAGGAAASGDRLLDQSGRSGPRPLLGHGHDGGGREEAGPPLSRDRARGGLCEGLAPAPR